MYKLLIVDDEPMICEGLKMMVDWQHYGFRDIRTAHNGEEALAKIGEDVPDLMITDIKMPGMNGISLVKEIRARHLDIRILVLSGYDDFEYVRTVSVQGIENYLLKPVNEDELNLNVFEVARKIIKEREVKTGIAFDENLIRENIINRWLYGAIGEKELFERAEFLKLNLEMERYQPFLLKGLGKEFAENVDLKKRIYHICAQVLKEKELCYYCQNYEGDTVAIWTFADGSGTEELIRTCMEKVQEETGIRLYAIVGNEVKEYWNVRSSFKVALKNGIFQTEFGESKEPPANDIEKNLAPFTIRMAKYALEHYDEEVSLKTLASHFKGNAAYMGQNFKKDTGKSFSDYLKEIRIKKAKELLVGKDYKAKEIGVKVGFPSDAYFSTVFKKETGMTPAEYRKELSK